MKHSKAIHFLLILLLFSAGLLLHGCGTESDPPPPPPPEETHPFEGGEGTAENPYQIADIEQLQAIDDTLYLDKHFIQTGDIDASASAGFENGSGFRRIGDREHPFTGRYDGQGFTISDLSLHMNTEEKHIGLFGYVKEGVIKDMRIENDTDPMKEYSILPYESMTGFLAEVALFTEDDLFEDSALGFLVGVNDGGHIENCFVQARVVGESISLGGLVGVNTGSIEHSVFKGYASNIRLAAGLVGINTGTIVDSSSEGEIAAQFAAGLVGQNVEGEIIRSSSSINVRVGRVVGGLVAYNSGVIHESFSKGNEIFNSRGLIGGLVAQNDGEIVDSYAVTDLQVFPDQSLDMFVGGFVGENRADGIVINSYSAGVVDASDEGATAGFIGSNDGELSAVYWDTESSGQDEGVGTGSAEGATGLATAQMSGPEAEANMPGFDWETVWRTTEAGYPVLRWEEE